MKMRSKRKEIDTSVKNRKSESKRETKKEYKIKLIEKFCSTTNKISNFVATLFV